MSEKNKSYPERLHEIFVRHLVTPTYTSLETEVALLIDEIISKKNGLITGLKRNSEMEAKQLVRNVHEGINTVEGLKTCECYSCEAALRILQEENAKKGCGGGKIKCGTRFVIAEQNSNFHQ